MQLYYGTKDSSTTAYKDLDDSWKAAGVETIHVHSSDDQGYVQDIFSQVWTRATQTRNVSSLLLEHMSLE